MSLFGMLGWTPPESGPQRSGPIQRPSRRSSLYGQRKANARPIPPPAAKRERIAAGRQKLMDKTARSRARSATARAMHKGGAS